MDWKRLQSLAETEVEAVFRALPAPLQAEARRVPVTYERYPGRALLRDGIAEDTMGLFLGPAYGEEAETAWPLPPQIILFLGNIMEEADGDEGVFRAEIRTTLLHELGHFLGLNEDEVCDRGLE